MGGGQILIKVRSVWRRVHYICLKLVQFLNGRNKKTNRSYLDYLKNPIVTSTYTVKQQSNKYCKGSPLSNKYDWFYTESITNDKSKNQSKINDTDNY